LYGVADIGGTAAVDGFTAAVDGFTVTVDGFTAASSEIDKDT
jgi:hypothetical protein